MLRRRLPCTNTAQRRTRTRNTRSSTIRRCMRPLLEPPHTCALKHPDVPGADGNRTVSPLSWRVELLVRALLRRLSAARARSSLKGTGSIGDAKTRRRGVALRTRLRFADRARGAKQPDSAQDESLLLPRYRAHRFARIPALVDDDGTAAGAGPRSRSDSALSKTARTRHGARLRAAFELLRGARQLSRLRRRP